MRTPGSTYQNRTPSPASRTSGANTPATVAGPRLLVVLSTTLLVIFGLLMVFSASSISDYVEGADPTLEAGRQVLFACFGVVALLAMRIVPHRAWQGFATWLLFGGSVLLLLLTALIGTTELGAQRWLNIGPVSFQPSELAKVGILLMMAKLVCDYQDGDMTQKHFLAWFAGLNGVIVVLVLVAQSDLGTTLICVAGIAAILWLAEIPLRWVGGYLGAVLLLGSLALTVGYRWDRITGFLNPWNDYYGSGYQLIHSFYAFSQGGIFGVGLGHSAEKYLYLPEAQTDFIFSIIGEELGLLGALAVIALFLAFLLGGLRMAQAAPDRFGAILCSSFAVIIVFQAFLNMGCAMGVLPVTGKPLPFISAGGTSLIVSLAMVGFMLSVSHASGEPPEYRQRREDLRLVRTGAAPDAYGMPSRGGARAAAPSRGRAYSAPRLADASGRRPGASRRGYPDDRLGRWA